MGEEIFSIAQHSLLVEAIFAYQTPSASREAKLTALLHDAPEYVIGDMISPFKAVIGGVYKDVERRLFEAILMRFGLSATISPVLTKAIKAADRDAAYYEATALAGFSEAEAVKIFGAPRSPAQHFATLLSSWRPKCAQAEFLARFAELHTL